MEKKKAVAVQANDNPQVVADPGEGGDSPEADDKVGKL